MEIKILIINIIYKKLIKNMKIKFRSLKTIKPEKFFIKKDMIIFKLNNILIIFLNKN